MTVTAINTSSTPRVSIGLPVYNGENYIVEAIESILGQTYTDIELLISDNASTDNTEQICRHYASLDNRVRYYRLSENIGAAGNFNKVFKYAKGEYFKWAAHDDRLAPDLIEKCVAILNDNEDCVLVYSQLEIIGRDGEVIEAFEPWVNAKSTSASERFKNMVSLHMCFEIFGLIRHCALELTPLMGAYAHGDGVLLARLSLLGRFVEIPETLFYQRRHDAQSMKILSDALSSQEYSNYAEWFDPALSGKIVFPYWRMMWEFICSVPISRLSLSVKLSCYFHVLRQVLAQRRRLFGDIRFAVQRLIKQI